MGKDGLVTPEETANDPEVLDLTGKVLKKHAKIAQLLQDRAELADLEAEVKENKEKVVAAIKAAFEKAGLRKVVTAYGQVYRVENSGKESLDKKALLQNLDEYLPENIVVKIMAASTKKGKPYSTYNYKAVKVKG